jgi:hypothetical protein
VSREIDGRELFDRVAKPSEKYDEDWTESMQETVRGEGVRVGRNEWDSGGPGAGAGVSYVYLFRDLFFSEDDVSMYGPCDTLVEAANAVGLLSANEAATKIWVNSKYRTEAENAIKLYDGLSKEQASALFNGDPE